MRFGGSGPHASAPPAQASECGQFALSQAIAQDHCPSPSPTRGKFFPVDVVIAATGGFAYGGLNHRAVTTLPL